MPQEDRPWRAPAAHGPISGTVELPGSKSVSNRALLLAAIAGGPSRLRGVLRARDTDLMTGALAALGAGIHSDQGVTTVEPGPLTGDTDIDCGLAGNVMRFVPAIAGLAVGRIGFHGDERAGQRPLGPLLQALRQVGVAVDPDAHSLPFSIDARGSVPGGAVEIEASASSQFISALLLAGSRYDRGVELVHRGDSVPSRPHIDMTVEMLRNRGVEVTADENHWTVAPGPIAGVEETIEPDLSNAAPFLAAAAVTGGRVTVRDWPGHTQQPGDFFPDILEQFGAEVDRSADELSVSGSGTVEGIEADLHDHGELTPAVAAVAALASSPTRIRGVAHLRGHESDRLSALAHELSNLGCVVEETEDGLDIKPLPLRTGKTFRSYADHRMAHAGAIIGLQVSPLYVDDMAATAKTFPGFADAWTALVVG